MPPPNIYYSALLMTAAVVCLIVSIMIWYVRRTAAGARPLFVFLLALSWWDITYAFFWAAFPGPTPYFWLDITLWATFIVPTAFLIFTLEFASLQRWLKRPALLVLMIEPLAAFILLSTDSWHNLFFGGKRVPSGISILNAGPVSWANIFYSDLLIFIAIMVLGGTIYRSLGIYRKQAITILMAIIIPWVVHISFMVNGGFLPDADATPFLFSFTGLIIAIALVRYGLLDIVPIARSVLIENMIDGVIVLDTQNRVVDINPTARNVIEVSGKTYMGEPVDEVLSDWPSTFTKKPDSDQMQVEVNLDDRHYEVRISPLLDHHNAFIGRLIVLRDITDRKFLEVELHHQATTDGLTGIFNRRHFQQLADPEIKRAIRLKRSLAIVLIDIDHFKNVNDTMGHATGDLALMAATKLCLSNIREIDVFARFGGDEFALLLTEANREQAHVVVERIRRSISAQPLNLDGKSVPMTISAGIANLSEDHETFDRLLRRADKALYRAKESGRNAVVMDDEIPQYFDEADMPLIVLDSEE